MAEMKSETVAPSGFKVRLLSRVVKPDSSPAEPQKADGSSPKSHDSKLQTEVQRKPSRLRGLTEELRAQEIAMRSHVPIIYLVDSAGVNLPYQGGVFPGQYGASRIFYYNSIMRRYLKVPQIAAVMGPCIAGGAYLPALSDIIIMVEGTSFMGLGGANLVKGATGQTIDNETLGGARTHNELSGVAHYRVKNDEECLARIREFVAELPVPVARSSQSHNTNDSKGEAAPQALTPLTSSPKRERGSSEPQAERGNEPKAPEERLYDIIPEDHRQPYSVRELLDCLLDEGHLDEFQ